MITRRTLAGALIVSLGLAAPAGARADATADARKAIQAAYTKRDAAEARKDMEGSMSSMAPDFVFISKEGQKGDMALLKRRMAPAFAMMQSVKSRSQVQSVSVKGKEATASVKSHMEMLILNPQTQVPQKIVVDATSVDLWTKTASGWLQKRMVAKSESGTLDGKSITSQLNLSGAKRKSGPTVNPKNTKKAG